MYAVTFDIDTNCLAANDTSHSKAYSDIRKSMEQLAKSMPVFATCVKDIIMLKIEENNDLMPAVKVVL